MFLFLGVRLIKGGRDYSFCFFFSPRVFKGALRGCALRSAVGKAGKGFKEMPPEDLLAEVFKVVIERTSLFFSLFCGGGGGVGGGSLGCYRV